MWEYGATIEIIPNRIAAENRMVTLISPMPDQNKKLHAAKHGHKKMLLPR